ncbi:MAG: 1-acyl-sn-glycerol-3-phosphate acyltransferase [Frankiaceae bacterium]|nr:1-acyl-sn-glycerol-3-phosphate acyltransferase [Frankiaceae bacterium]
MFYWIIKSLLAPFLHLGFRPWVQGLENVPDEGGALLASNHLSFSDSVFLPLVVPRRVTFLAKSEYFFTRGVKGRAKALFFRGIGYVPVERTGGKASAVALDAGLELLRNGELLGIYPEGTRSPDARLYRGKTGVARMALEAGVPVIPVAMIDTEKLQPPGKVMPKFIRPGVIIGEPLDFSRYSGMDTDRFVLRSVTDEIMYAIMKLSGQEYVDEYASSAKARIARAAKQKAAETKAAEHKLAVERRHAATKAGGHASAEAETAQQETAQHETAQQETPGDGPAEDPGAATG